MTNAGTPKAPDPDFAGMVERYGQAAFSRGYANGELSSPGKRRATAEKYNAAKSALFAQHEALQAEVAALKRDRDEAREDARVRLAQRHYDDAYSRAEPVIRGLVKSGASGDFAVETAANEVLEAAFRNTFDEYWKSLNAEVERLRKLVDMATRFDIADRLSVEKRSPGKWAVFNGSAVLADDGLFEYEPLPSSRDDEFIARTRFTFDEAMRRARSTLNQPPGPQGCDGQATEEGHEAKFTEDGESTDWSKMS